jgi:hypothetical protein
MLSLQELINLEASDQGIKQLYHDPQPVETIFQKLAGLQITKVNRMAPGHPPTELAWTITVTLRPIRFTLANHP